MNVPSMVLIGLLVLGAIVLIGIEGGEVVANPDYASGCVSCHGDYNSGTYISNVDGQNWGTDLMSGHSDFLIGSNDCGICHTSPGKSPVYLATSDGGDGLEPIGCLGCHGRNEGDAGVTGAGLRQHHYNNGVTSCLNCHPDADPSAFTPVGEDVLPPYYANPGTGHPNIPDSACNPAPGYPEDVLGAVGTGLDNDGDNLYDENDADCSATGIEDELAFGVELGQNYPNPFNPETTIRFTLQERTNVRLDVYSADGTLVRTLTSQLVPPGSHHVVWDGRDAEANTVSTGVYFYRLTVGKRTLTKKMVLLK
ncbi:MAG: T9SS type A sorting domain-containing protein [Candidatus Latescibacterota bacterium]|nr:MAG: T9SS type A sorting domain-containing protein [Candidatus Latescibacterota bacterium]